MAYLASTAFIAAFLGRDDGRRPPWFTRVLLPSTDILPSEYQESVTGIARIACTKVRQDIVAEPGPESMATSGMPSSNWQAAVHDARVIWRTCFAAMAAKANVPAQAVPVYYLVASGTLIRCLQGLLSQVWAETLDQFTMRVNQYRGPKSRPQWQLLETRCRNVLSENGGFDLGDPVVKPPVLAGQKPAASLQDFMEEVLAIRFAIAWLSDSMKDAQEFLEARCRRKNRSAGSPRNLAKTQKSKDPEKQIAAMKEKAVDSFAFAWSPDAEMRGVTSVVTRLIDGLDGPGARDGLSTVVAQILLAVWKGAHPLFADLAAEAISDISEAQTVAGQLPTPHPRDLLDGLETAGFDKITQSYCQPSAECQALVQAVMPVVVKVWIRIQACVRGFMLGRVMRRGFALSPIIAKSCNGPR